MGGWVRDSIGKGDAMRKKDDDDFGAFAVIAIFGFIIPAIFAALLSLVLP